MKKYLVLLLSAFLVVSCGTKKSENSTNSGTVKNETVAETSTSKVEKTEEKNISSKSDEEQIKELFENFQDSMVKRDWAKYVKTINSETVKFYDKILDLAKKAKKEEILKLEKIEMVTILHLKFTTDKDVLLSFKSWEDILADSINKWRIWASAWTLVFWKAEVNRESAWIFVKMPWSEEMSPTAIFKAVKENGEWKIDMYSTIKSPEAEKSMEQIDETVLKKMYGEKYDSLFEPLEK